MSKNENPDKTTGFSLVWQPCQWLSLFEIFVADNISIHTILKIEFEQLGYWIMFVVIYIKTFKRVMFTRFFLRVLYDIVNNNVSQF